MDDMGTPGPFHPAHRGLKTPDNVIKMPGRNIGRIRKFKNDMLDAVLGPEQVEYPAETPVEEPGRSTAHFENGQSEAKIISMGKFKEDKANRELMGKQYE